MPASRSSREQQHIYAHPSGDLLFISNFINADEERSLLTSLYGVDYAKGTTNRGDEGNTAPPPRLPWVQLSRRRLLNLGGVPGNNERALMQNRGAPLMMGGVGGSEGEGGEMGTSNSTTPCASSSPTPKITPMIPEPIPQWAMRPVGDRLLAVSAGLEKGVGAITPPTTTMNADDGKGERRNTIHVVVDDEGTEPTTSSLTKALATVLAQCSLPTSPALPILLPPARICSTTINHILVNEYLCPNGILGHEDGPVYEPIVAIVSAESSVMLRFESKEWRRMRGEAAVAARQKGCGGAYGLSPASELNGATNSSSTSPIEPLVPPPDAIIEVYLPPRSFVLFRGRFYTDYLHAVPDGADADTYHEAYCLNYGLVVAGRGENKDGAMCADDSGVSMMATVGGTTTVPRGHRRVSFTYRRVLHVARLSAASLFGRRR